MVHLVMINQFMAGKQPIINNYASILITNSNFSGAIRHKQVQPVPMGLAFRQERAVER
ncbi:Uncharacterised protein [Serratia odorifera]|uniref:Uncharacterized protein n=2 Tax=Serratia odorifera TaxID=618 RepID=D4E906_SEROD|nr:hypothetical protein HMPREF0758_4656 [Serratia odorifera DSM 4582]VDZ65379.1 Uncharacterised protein [Serratia odorifera]